MENKIDHIIARVLSGEASAKDILGLSKWLNEDSRHQKEFCELKNYWDAEVSMNQTILPALSIEKLQQKIEKQHHTAKRKHVWKYAIPAAVAITLLCILSVTFFTQYTNQENYEYYTYLTNDNKTDLTMNDGTKITLNKNSRLTYSNAYGKENRSIQLEGEAYFEVAKDSLKPFNVTVGNSSITVLGLFFNVRKESDSNDVTATLVEGSIRFEAAEQKVLLKPGQQLIFNQNTNHIDIQNVDTEEYTSWKNGLLKYRSVSFAALIAELRNKYQVEIVIENKRLKDPSLVVSGSFSEDQSIEQIFKVISKSLPFKWRKSDGIYYIN